MESTAVFCAMSSNIPMGYALLTITYCFAGPSNSPCYKELQLRLVDLLIVSMVTSSMQKRHKAFTGMYYSQSHSESMPLCHYHRLGPFTD